MSCVVQTTKDDLFSFIQQKYNRIKGFQNYIFLLLWNKILMHTSMLRKKRNTNKHAKQSHHQCDEVQTLCDWQTGAKQWLPRIYYWVHSEAHSVIDHALGDGATASHLNLELWWSRKETERMRRRRVIVTWSFFTISVRVTSKFHLSGHFWLNG